MQWYEEIMDTAQEAVDYIGSSLSTDGSMEEPTRQVLTDFAAAMDGVAERLSQEKGTLMEKCRRYALNAAYSGQKALAAEDARDAWKYFFYEVRPLFLDLRYQLDLEYLVLQHPEVQDAYLAQTIAAFETARKRPRRTGFKYRVSIIVPAYNKVEYSRCAIDSLFRHTDFSHGDIELITINDGSSDGTEAYFNSLPHEKKINLKYNVYNHLGWGIARHIAEGEYVVYFSNDAVATPHWLENLLAVHQAEKDVFWVVPTCNENCISNRQGIPVDYENRFEAMPEMEAFAAAHNVSNPLLWEERALLMPFVSVVPNLFDVPEIRADYRYVLCDFEDDDFSATLRRSGFRQILAKDTFVHHFGGVTLNEVRTTHGNYKTIIEMRPVFQHKWGIDPWTSRGHLVFLEQILKDFSIGETPSRISFIEPMFGEGLLTVRNYFRRLQTPVIIDAIVTREQYMMEAAYMADSVIRLTSLDHLPDRVNGTYDMVILGAFLNVVPISDIISFFKETYGLLNAKGVLYVSLLNYNSFEHVMENLPNDVPHLIYDSILPLNGERVFPVPRLVHALKKEFSNKSVWVGYGVQSHYFGDISLFEQTTNEILGTSDDLHYLLSGDMVALCIR
ncbi:glycosyltransferase family 2 protein [uncultured Selenomonas sp.]|uniref:glycosyltransferase family 2 protein n=1 Tax=uncultured Selenomonas sp. TaxID=159275 RepID=UPI0025EE73A8|nr:glycosyltransferase family 2 protein [uncultured Selenomonas sp.]